MKYYSLIYEGPKCPYEGWARVIMYVCEEREWRWCWVDETRQRMASCEGQCGVCDKKMKANVVLYMRLVDWVHERGSGVEGSLKKVDGKGDDLVVDESEW